MASLSLVELLRGKGAHADPIACVEDVSAEMAARQVAEFPHSIGAQVFHANYWMDYELRRIRGLKPKYPEHNSESFPAEACPADAQEWDALRKTFADLLSEYSALANLPAEELSREVESIHDGDKKVAGTLADVIDQMIAHNSYHVGQIAMLRRLLGIWPPRAGGDTW